MFWGCNHYHSYKASEKLLAWFTKFNDNLFRRPFGVEQEYFVQLVVEQDDSLKLTTVGYLIEKMFKEQNISLTKASLSNMTC